MRILVASLIVGFYFVIKGLLLSPNPLLNIVISLIAVLVVGKDTSLVDLIKIIASYFIVEIIAKAIETYLLNLILPNAYFSSFIVCVSMVITIVFLKCLFKVAKINKLKKKVYLIELSFNGKSYKTKAFYDSGNLLYHKGVPVIMISDRLVQKLNLIKSEKIGVTTVLGYSLLDGGKVLIKIFSDKKAYKLSSVYYCVSDKMLSRDYEVLLHSEMEVV